VAVLAVLAVIALWWVSTHGKGNVAARLGAWGAAVVVIWLMVGFKYPHTAGMMASDFAAGISQAASGFGSFLHALTG
jgi:hypothetical protein